MTQSAGKCPVCHKPLYPGDDIVTCPSCGAPYHRECYQQQGDCLFAAQHGSGFEYKPEPAPGEPKTQHQNSGGVLCKHCQTVNDAKNIFCENCGAPLHESAGAAAGGQSTRGGYSQPPPGPGPGGYGPGSGYGQSGYGQGGYNAYGAGPQMNFVGQIKGIAARDWAEYIGKSTPYYLQRLAAMERSGSKISFIFSAFLFTPWYFAYRKMWGWAALTFLLFLLSLVPQILYIAVVEGVGLPFAFSAENLEIAMSVVNTVSWVVQLVFGLFALYLFRENGAKQIGLIRRQNGSDTDYHAQLGKKGGVSWLGVAALVAVFLVLYFILFNYMGDALLSFFYPGLSFIN